LNVVLACAICSQRLDPDESVLLLNRRVVDDPQTGRQIPLAPFAYAHPACLVPVDGPYRIVGVGVLRELEDRRIKGTRSPNALKAYYADRIPEIRERLTVIDAMGVPRTIAALQEGIGLAHELELSERELERLGG
jgi:hypothetical protein